MTKWRAEMASLQNADRDPIAPQYLIGLIDQIASTDAILTCDSGTIATWAARHWTNRGDREFYLSGNLATMAPGLPYAIAAQQAHPGRQVIAFVGDGGFAMLMAEFLTAVRHQLPVKVFINNNGAYGQILWEQMVLGYPEFGVRHTSSRPRPGRGLRRLRRQGDQGRPARAGRTRRARVPRPRAGRLQRQPRRATATRRDRLLAGEGLPRGVRARPAAPRGHREDAGR